MFESVLVANRGEIAARVIRTLNALGIRSIAVFSDADAHARHVALADEAVRLGPAAASESYLSIDRVLDAAQSSGAEAIHPGYGFLSENPAFARACASAGIVFIGPPAEAMELLGDKTSAKLAAQAAGVPVLDGLQRPGLADEEIIAFAQQDPGRLPLMVKAAAGGGGRGMRVVHSVGELPDALAAARREALAGFGDDSLLVERYVERARHVEIQLMADAHGDVVYLGERECSLQRRHQKVLEESPSPAVSAQLRERMGSAAAELARRAGYVGAGTAEFLVPVEDPERFAFLEVNARLQVEHPVTELVTGYDLVELQLRVAAGEPLGITQDEVAIGGHAVEVRVCAEDAAAGFLPSTGRIALYREPRGPGIRVDSGVAAGLEIGGSYDSLLAKVIAYGADRAQAFERLSRALGDLRLLGIVTNAGYLARLVAAPEVLAGDMDTGLLERGVVSAVPEPEEVEHAVIAAGAVATLERFSTGAGGAGDPWDSLVGWRLAGESGIDWEFEAPGGDALAVRVTGAPQHARVHVGGRELSMSATALGADRIQLQLDGLTRIWDHAVLGPQRWVSAGADAFALALAEPVAQTSGAVGAGALEAPMPGSVLSVRVRDGDAVAAGDVLVIVESMKMELAITSPQDARVSEVRVAAGDRVSQGQSLVELEAIEAGDGVEVAGARASAPAEALEG